MRRNSVLAAFAGLLVLPVLLVMDAAAQDRILTSPWEHDMWRSASPSMQNYICNYSRQPATWCPEVMRAQAVNPENESELYGPQLTADDARWLRLVASADLRNLSREDALFIKKRAEELRDPQAMEALGYLYAEGIAFERDYAKAYLWYGRVYLSGETRVKANLDILWDLIHQIDREKAAELVRVFKEESDAARLQGLSETSEPAGDGAASP